jgi:hypothetical protein
MKKLQLKKFDYQINKDHNHTFKNEVVKTTNINILLNRVRQKKKIELKNKLILSILMVSILSLAGILMFVN